MNKLLAVYKPQYKTPYQLIQQLRKQYPEYKDEKIGYAGRLDPLAHGVLLLMIGEAAKERDIYLALPKVYECEALFGVTTDTYDVLGLLRKKSEVRNTKSKTNSNDKKLLDLEKSIRDFVKRNIGKQTQQYPPFSSKPVQGKPLYWWAKNNKLAEITIPYREITIANFELLSIGDMAAKDLQKSIHDAVSKVDGEFRQEAIKNSWQKFFVKNSVDSFVTARFRISCSSGTYVRGLVHSLGEEIGSGAVATEILRTQVGEYTLDAALRLTD